MFCYNKKYLFIAVKYKYQLFVLKNAGFYGKSRINKNIKELMLLLFL